MELIRSAFAKGVVASGIEKPLIFPLYLERRTFNLNTFILLIIVFFFFLIIIQYDFKFYLNYPWPPGS